MNFATLGSQSPARWLLGVTVAFASTVAACSSSSSSAAADSGSDDAASSNEDGGDSPSANAEGGGSDDATPDQVSADVVSAMDSSEAMADSGGTKDSAADAQSHCSNSQLCTKDVCCARPNQTCGTFTLSGDNVVDSATGLTWERSFADLTDYPTATTDCTAWGGRLPTATELTAYYQARNSTSCAFTVDWATPTSTDCIWTSTPYSGGGAHDCVYYSNTPMSTSLDGDSNYVQCVK